MKKKWTVRDIDLLRKYYLENYSLKMMAQLLGHTPTAINKCLTRFYIRPLKRSLFFHLPKKLVKVGATSIDIPPVTSPDTVIFYANHVLALNIQTHPDGTYTQGLAPITFAQILLRVNMDRTQRHLSVYRGYD